MMNSHNKPIRRARLLAFSCGGVSVVLELVLLIALSYTQSAAGHLAADKVQCAPLAKLQANPVVIYRKMELSL